MRDPVYNGLLVQRKGRISDCFFTGVLGSPGTPMANSLTLNGNYVGTLRLQQVNGPAVIGPGGINLAGGAIEQDTGLPIECGGDFNWTGGNLNATSPFLADLDLAAGKAFNAGGPGDDSIGSNINLTGGNNGVINKFNNKITFVKNAGINIANTSTLNLVDGRLETTGTGKITNAGNLYKTPGAAPFVIDLPIVNSGTFQLQNGTLTINKKDATASFNQSGGTAELWASTTLFAKEGFYMGGGNLFTRGAIAAINDGDILIEGGVIRLRVDDPNAVGILSANRKLTIQGNAEYQAKVDSTNNTADRLSVTGVVTLGGNSKLTAVSINLVGGRVALNKNWTIISSGAQIDGDFNTKVLAFGDGTAGLYTAAKVNMNKEYQLSS